MANANRRRSIATLPPKGSLVDVLNTVLLILDAILPDCFLLRLSQAEICDRRSC